MKYILISLLTLLLFTACSGKKYFEPENTSRDIELNEKSISSDIKSMNKIGATLKDNKFITKDGVSQNELPEGFELINLTDDGKVIATNYIDKILIADKEISVSNVVVAASLRDDKLALVYSDNSMELLDINTNKTLYKNYLPISLANDTRIANPLFMGNLILFPSLNGRVVIVSNATNEAVRNISVDPDSQFNNIIYLDVIPSSQTLIVASSHRIVAVSPKDTISKEYDLRDIIVNNGDIYIATVDGQIVKLDATLNPVARKKYTYAKIHALAFSNGSLYAVESQGFLIKLNEDFSKDTIYKFGFDNEKRMIAIGNRIYLDSDYITLP